MSNFHHIQDLFPEAESLKLSTASSAGSLHSKAVSAHRFSSSSFENSLMFPYCLPDMACWEKVRILYNISPPLFTQLHVVTADWRLTFIA